MTEAFLTTTLAKCGPLTTANLVDVSAASIGRVGCEHWRRHVWAELRRLHRNGRVTSRKRGGRLVWKLTEFGRMYVGTVEGAL